MEEVFANLESNNVQTVENAKKELTKTFSQSKCEFFLKHFFPCNLSSPKECINFPRN